MALAFQSFSSANHNTASSSHSISLPSGTSSGDFLLLLVAYGTVQSSSNTPSGWTLIDAGGTASSSFATYRKIASGGESGPTLNVSPSSTISYICYRFSDAEWGAKGSLTSGNSDSPDAPDPGVSSSSTAYFLVATCGWAGDSYATAYPSGYDVTATSASGTDTGDGAQGVAAAVLSTTVTNNPSAFGISTGNDWLANTYQIKDIPDEPPNEGDSSGSVTVSYDVVGNAVHQGSSVGDITVSCNAVGYDPPNEGSSSGATSVSGNAVGYASYEGASAGSITVSCNAVGYVPPNEGSSSGSITVSCDAVGYDPPNEGSSSGATSVSGNIVGNAVHEGASSESITVSCNAVGYDPPNEGSSSGSATVSCNAVGYDPPNEGDSSGPTSVSWEAEGYNARSGSSASTITVSCAATGRTPSNSGTSAGSISVSSTADGYAVHCGYSAASISVSGTAEGYDVHCGYSAGVISTSGNIDGFSPPNSGSSVDSITVQTWAIGYAVHEGSSAGSITVTCAADGANGSGGSSCGAITISCQAEGYCEHTGVATSSITISSTVIGSSCHEGYSVGSISVTSSADGNNGASGSVVCSITISCAADGSASHAGSGDCTITVSCAVEGKDPDIPNSGSANCSVGTSSLVQGYVTHAGNAAGQMRVSFAQTIRVGGLHLELGSFDDVDYKTTWEDSKRCPECDCFCTKRVSGVETRACIPKEMHITITTLANCGSFPDGSYLMRQCRILDINEFEGPDFETPWPTKFAWVSDEIVCPYSGAHRWRFVLECVSALYDESLQYPAIRLTLSRYSSEGIAYSCSAVNFDRDDAFSITHDDGTTLPLPRLTRALAKPASTCDPIYFAFPNLVEDTFSCNDTETVACCGGYIDSESEESSPSSWEVVVTV